MGVYELAQRVKPGLVVLTRRTRHAATMDVSGICVRGVSPGDPDRCTDTRTKLGLSFQT